MPTLLALSQFKIQNLKLSIPSLLLALLITTYAAYFSWYTINRHNTLNSYAADLSLIDQPMWNTVRGPGGFMELTWDGQQQPRLAEHFEPILIPLALLFLLWDEVRILLIAQSLALALGALPVYWIARYQLTISNPTSPIPPPQSPIPSPQPHLPSWAALAFAGVYLLSPHLQAANIADFHADSFVVTPLLFAFWYATQKRWSWMWVWAIVAMLTKETLPTLTAMLGLWLLGRAYLRNFSKITRTPPAKASTPTKHRNGVEASAGKTTETTVNGQRPALSLSNGSTVSLSPELLHGLGLILISTGWFLIATFLIVAPLARQYFGTDGPIYFANRYSGGLAGLPQLLVDPARWQYLFGLLAAVGFLPLLAPELLILGLPVLVANLLSNFPGQYSGEQHYSAPIVVALIIAAIYGSRRLLDNIPPGERDGQSFRMIALITTVLWLLTWSLSYHALRGWTPLSTRLETYRPGPATIRLPDLMAQIPPEATVSASAAIHPHLAHRRVIYSFPTVEDADYILVDVTDIPGVHPNDAQAKILSMLSADWHLLQANQGLILAQKSPETAPFSMPACSSTLPLPCAFFDFTRTTTSPTYPTPLIFREGHLRLLGYDVHDDPDDGVVFRFYWQTTGALPENLHLWPLVYDDLGRLLSDPTQVPMIATVWYPPAAWRPGETVVTETLPQLLPDTFHLGLAVGPDNSFADPARRFPISSHPDQVSLYPGYWTQLATFRRQGPYLIHQAATPSLHPLSATDTRFGPAIHLTGFWFDDRLIRAGDTLPVLLQWTATQPPRTDFTVFIHLLAPDGRLVAQSDAYPTWLTPAPTSQWPLHRPMLDSHFLSLPDHLPPATYTLQLGLYNAQTLARLTLPDGSDSFRLGQVEVR